MVIMLRLGDFGVGFVLSSVEARMSMRAFCVKGHAAWKIYATYYRFSASESRVANSIIFDPLFILILALVVADDILMS